MNLPEWMTSWYFIGAMIVVLLGLIGLLLVLRNQKED